MHLWTSQRRYRWPKRRVPKRSRIWYGDEPNGDGFQTIATDLNIARNTVKSRLKKVGAYEVIDAQKLLLAGISAATVQIFSPHWSSWENNLAPNTAADLRNVPYETFWREFRRRHPNVNVHYHKNHESGLRTEIDYKGYTHGLGYIDKATGEFIACRLFGQVLCNSCLFFSYAHYQ